LEQRGSEELKRYYNQLSPELQGWADLRLAALEAHQGRVKAALKQLKARPIKAGHPASVAAGALIERLRARSQMRPGRLGVLLPLSGPYEAIGRVALQGIQMARNRGGAGIELVIADTQGDAEQARLEVDRLVHQERVAAIIGPIGSRESKAAAVMAERFEVPIMTLSSRPGICALGLNVFRHRFTAAQEGRALARYAVQRMGIRRFAILFPEAAHGRALMRAFWQNLLRLGGEVRGAQAYPLRSQDFGPPIKKLIGRYHLSARKPDPYWARLNRKARDRALHLPPEIDFEGLLLIASPRRARHILPYLAYWDIELRDDPEREPGERIAAYQGDPPPLVQLFGSSGFNHPRLARLSPAQNSVFMTGFWPQAPEAEAFSEAWQRKQGRPPPALAAHAYDALLLLAKALKGRGQREAVRRALHEAQHNGIFGRTHVGSGGEVKFGVHVMSLKRDQGVIPRQYELNGGDLPPVN